MFIGVYLIMVFDPQILFNDGFYPLLHVVMPDGCLLHPKFPSALGCRTHALSRLFDMLGGALAQAGARAHDRRRLRHEPLHPVLGLGRPRRVLLLDGDPLRRHPGPTDRRRDGRPLVVAALREHPDRVPRGLLPGADRRLHDDHRLGRSRLPPGRQRDREALRLPRAGRGLDPRRPLADPSVGHARRRAGRAVGEDPRARRRHARSVLPSKCDEVEVEPGDMLVYRTAGGGGWKDPLDRPAERVEADVGVRARLGARRRRPATASCSATTEVDEATEAERARQREERGDVLDFDLGPPLEEILARCKDETGLEPPVPRRSRCAGRRWSRARMRSPRAAGTATAGCRDGMRHEGFHGRPGSARGRRCRRRHEPRLHRPGLAARLRPRQRRRGDRAAACGGPRGGLPVVYTTVAYDEADRGPPRSSSTRCPRC